MVAARGGHLEGPLGLDLAGDVAQVAGAAGSTTPLGAGGGGLPGPPRSTSNNSTRSLTPVTAAPSTRAASRNCPAGTTTRSKPLRTAASTAGSNPRTVRTRPSSPSSPNSALPSSAAGSHAPFAAPTAATMLRS